MKKSPLYTRGNRLSRNAIDETKWCIFNNEYYRLNTEIDRRKKYKDGPKSKADLKREYYAELYGRKPAVWEVISPAFFTNRDKITFSRTHRVFKTHAEAIEYVSYMNKEITKARKIDAEFYEGKRDTPA